VSEAAGSRNTESRHAADWPSPPDQQDDPCSPITSPFEPVRTAGGGVAVHPCGGQSTVVEVVEVVDGTVVEVVEVEVVEVVEVEVEVVEVWAPTLPGRASTAMERATAMAIRCPALGVMTLETSD
jgi:hypothetical protein